MVAACSAAPGYTAFQMTSASIADWPIDGGVTLAEEPELRFSDFDCSISGAGLPLATFEAENLSDDVAHSAWLVAATDPTNGLTVTFGILGADLPVGTSRWELRTDDLGPDEVAKGAEVGEMASAESSALQC